MIGIQWNAIDGAQATGQASAQAGATGRSGDAAHDWSAIWQRAMNREAGREVHREANREANRDANHGERRRDDGSDADCFQGLMPSYPMPLPCAPSSAAAAGSVAPGTSLSNALADARAAQEDTSAGRSMRLHAEWSATGVRLWVGASLSDQAGMSHLGRPLRAGLERQGVRLLSLVCNGQIIYADAIASNADRVTAGSAHAGSAGRIDPSRVEGASTE